MSKFLLFDTETTGLIGNSLLADRFQPRMFEFYGMIIDGLNPSVILDELEFRVNPGVRMDEKASQATGVRNEDLANEPPLGMFAKKLIDFIESADAVVAHNLSFDLAIVEGDLARFDFAVRWPAEKICTVEQTEWLKGYRLSLTALHEHLFGVGFEKAHSARGDVHALWRCFIDLYEKGYVL